MSGLSVGLLVGAATLVIGGWSWPRQSPVPYLMAFALVVGAAVAA